MRDANILPNASSKRISTLPGAGYHIIKFLWTFPASTCTVQPAAPASPMQIQACDRPLGRQGGWYGESCPSTVSDWLYWLSERRVVQVQFQVEMPRTVQGPATMKEQLINWNPPGLDETMNEDNGHLHKL